MIRVTSIGAAKTLFGESLKDAAMLLVVIICLHYRQRVTNR
jgi:hypothetical protein